MKKGQFGIEFIVVLGALLIIISSVTIPLYANSRESVGEMTDMSLVRGAANKLAFSIDMAYVEGPGAQKNVDYTLPDGIDNIKIEDSGDSDNVAELMILSSVWEDDNTVSVDTLLHPNNHPPVILGENIMTKGEHNVVITCELDPNTKIKIEEV